jgi:hypothetical protein
VPPTVNTIAGKKNKWMKDAEEKLAGRRTVILGPTALEKD